MSSNCFSQWSMRLASHCSSLWASVPKCHVLVARDCPTSYLNMLGWFFTCVFFTLALLLNTNSPSPLPLLSASGVTFLMFFLFLSVGLMQVTAEYFQCTYNTWWYLGNLLPWLCSPTPPFLDAFCSPKPFPFHLVWATWGNWSWWKSLFSSSSPSLTRICGLGWLLICLCKFWAAKKKRRAVQSGTHSQEWRAVGMGTLVSRSRLGQQRFAVANMRLFCKLLICTSIWGHFFICSRWAVIVSYLPSLVFLSFISNQTISALLAKLYIVSHSCFLQTQYPPWPILADFHLHCCVYSFYKLLFQH